MYGEGNMCAIDMRDGDAPPGSWSTSCMRGHSRDPRGPAGTIVLASDGGVAQGKTRALRRAEAGSRTGSYYR